MFFNELKGGLDSTTTPVSGSRVVMISLIMVSLAMVFAYGTGHAAAANSSVIYVNGTGGHDANNGYTWTTAKQTIKNATATVVDNGTVNIGQGTYKGTGNINIIINKNLTIQGVSQSNTIIDAQGKNQIFNITSVVSVNIQNLTLTNGYSITNGGAINNQGNLTLTNSTFTNNTASGNIWDDGGGAIYSAGNLNVNNSTFTNNTGDIGGAINNFGDICSVNSSIFTNNTGGSGGAIYNKVYLTVTNSIFTNNTAAYGGAIFKMGTLNVNSSTFKDNSATLGGSGAIYSDGPLNVANANFTGNTGNFGGAIGHNYGTLNIINSTFTNNTVRGYYSSGGAILFEGNLNVTNSTFTDNTATHGVGGAIYDQKTMDNLEASLNVTSSIFTNNTATSGGAIYNTGTATVRFNRIIGNSNYDIYNNGGSVDALYNWWGTNFKGTDPITAGRINSGNASSWMVLSINATPTNIKPNGTSTVTADLLHDNGGVYHNPAAGVIPYTGPANFGTNKGSIKDTNFSNGVATSTFNAGIAVGVATVTSKVDQATVNTNITINSNPPTVTSVNPVNGAVNVQGNNRDVDITFSSPIMAGSAYGAIYVWNTVLNVQKIIAKSIKGNTLTLTMAYNWMPNTLYNIIIPSGAVTDQYGNTLASNYSSNLTTAPPLKVIGITPADGAIKVPNTARDVTILFSSPIIAGSLYDNIYILNYALNVQKLITKTINGNTLILTAVYNWAANTSYSVFLPLYAVTDQYGDTITTDITYKITSTFTSI
jgi:predicted outer membrane repeat protein